MIIRVDGVLEKNMKNMHQKYKKKKSTLS